MLVKLFCSITADCQSTVSLFEIKLEIRRAVLGSGSQPHRPRKDRLLKPCRLSLRTLQSAACRHGAPHTRVFSVFLSRTPSRAKPSTPWSAQRVEHGLHKQRGIKALLRAGVQDTEKSGCVASLRHKVEMSIFSRSASPPSLHKLHHYRNWTDPR